MSESGKIPKINEAQLYYRLALSFVTGIGARTTAELLQVFGTAREVLEAPARQLAQLPGMGPVRIAACKDPAIFRRAEQELNFLRQNGITVLVPEDDAYPWRLQQCADAPGLLYYKGTANLNTAKVISVVGTRNPTEYGHRLCDELLSGLRACKDLLLVSGLAYGIDTLAHKAALHQGVPTIGVLGHGLDTLYPAANKQLAKNMSEQGGLLTEFPSDSRIDKGNFPARNRVVAGLADVTVVVESDLKGGAMITAAIAGSYNREVAAFPGRTTDVKSSGTNQLIRRQEAAMITSAAELLEFMNWEGTTVRPAAKNIPLLYGDAQKIMDLLLSKDTIHTDELLLHTGMDNTLLAATLLDLEMQQLIRRLPGQQYRLI